MLFTLCREYIVTGRAVASAGLARHLEWSSATLRHELAALEELGLLRQAHQSAGRVPTAAGMRHYIGSLGTLPQPRAELRRAVDISLGDTVQGPESMRAAAQVLSELVGCVAVTLVGEGRFGVMRQVDLVPMQGRRVLIALGLDDHSRHVHPVTLTAELNQDSLLRLQERLRWLCLGKTLDQARADLTRMWHEHDARIDILLAESLRVGLWLCTAAALDPLWLQIAGQRLLTGGQTSNPGLETILVLLDDYHRLAEVLCQLLPEQVGAARASVHVSPNITAISSTATTSETTTILEASGLSLVGCRLQPSDDHKTTAVALLGLDHMDYEAVIPLVEYAAKALAVRTGEG